MLKYTGKGMTIDRIRLLEKTGGRSGDYQRVD
jgi:molybdenum cofactor biosynthesis enzyme